MKIIRDVKNINFDKPMVATVGAFDGIHLGQEDLPVADVRKIIGIGRYQFKYFIQ